MSIVYALNGQNTTQLEPISVKSLAWSKAKNLPIVSEPTLEQRDLDELKAELSDIRRRDMYELYKSTRDKLFPDDTSGSRRHFNRAGDKLMEIIDSLPIMKTSSGADCKVFLDVAGGPGSFSEVLLKKKLIGYGITLDVTSSDGKSAGQKEISGASSSSLSWYPELESNKNFTIIWGKPITTVKRGKEITNHGDGDLYNPDNIDAAVNQVDDHRPDLVVSDGGIGVDVDQETASARLILSEIVLAVQTIKAGGNFLCKLFDVRTKFTTSLLYAVTSMFEKSYIVKPKRSRAVNSESYLVCLGYLDTDDVLDLSNYLADVHEEIFNKNKRTKITDLPDTLFDEFDHTFVESLNEAYSDLNEKQADALNTILSVMDIPPSTKWDSQKYVTDATMQTDQQVYIDINSQTGQINGTLSKLVSPSTVRYLVEDGVICFPYKRFHMGDIYEMFVKLKDHKQIVRYDDRFDPKALRLNFKGTIPNLKIGTKYVILIGEGDYNINKLTDYFTEPVRMVAHVKGHKLSPSEFWTTNCDWAIDSLRKTGKSVSSYEMREFIFKHCKEATQFKATISKYAYQWVAKQLKHPIKVLDPCAGWGDRLLGALACDDVISYTSTDPNPDLVSGHAEMIKYFRPSDRSKTYTSPITMGAEKITSDKVGKVHLVFTSPPYYNYEDYTNEKGQSIEGGKSFDDWIQDFLYAMLDNSWSCILDSGYMMIHLSDVQKIAMTEPMYNHMAAKNNAIFVGAMLAKAKNIIPIWIWRKKE